MLTSQTILKMVREKEGKTDKQTEGQAETDVTKNRQFWGEGVGGAAASRETMS